MDITDNQYLKISGNDRNIASLVLTLVLFNTLGQNQDVGISPKDIHRLKGFILKHNKRKYCNHCFIGLLHWLGLVVADVSGCGCVCFVGCDSMVL